MQYPYPAEFPQTSQARVSAESVRAARDFEEAKGAAHNYLEIEALLRSYILRVFLAFVREARELGCQGLWTADRLESESREFLRQCTIEAWHEKGYDRSGHRLPDAMASNWGGSIRPDILRAFERSPEWKGFQDILLEVADAQARRLEDERQAAERTTWEDITISFLSDERVQVEVGKQLKTFNYAEMGFEDRRNGKPNNAWGLLRVLAVNGGVISNAVAASKDFIALGKRFERLRTTLKQHFGISSDPIPLDSKEYRCRFNLKRGPSYNT
jgi:hypothetical protein